MKPQTKRVLDYLSARGCISQLDALHDIGCMRLGARIHELKLAGYNIRKELVDERNRFGEPVRFARYYLIEGGKA